MTADISAKFAEIFGAHQWEPSRLTEIVRAPGCSPVLGGIKLPASGLLRRGTQGEALHTQGDKAFYNYHTWSFPLLVMLDLFVVDRCVQDGYLDLDLMYLSELDPTWSFDQLAFFTTPEIALTSNPLAQAACVADAVAANADEPLDVDVLVRRIMGRALSADRNSARA